MSLKYCISGGEPLNPEVLEQWKIKTGLNIYEMYGQTETVGSNFNVLVYFQECFTFLCELSSL